MEIELPLETHCTFIREEIVRHSQGWEINRKINCRHALYPFVEGRNTNNMHPPDVSDANEYYKKQQKQRALEREIRQAKRNLQLVEEIGDPTEIAKFKKQVRDRQSNLREYINREDLPRRRDKERVL